MSIASYSHSIRITTLAVACFVGWSSAWAAPRSDTILPAETKGYVSVAQPTESLENWRQTQLGRLTKDPALEPFVESMKRQLDNQLELFDNKLGLKWDDLEGVPGGELSCALIERPGRDAALAISIDVTGHGEQADAMLTKVERRLVSRGATKSVKDRNGTELLVFESPAEDRRSKTRQTVYFVKEDMLCGVDSLELAEDMIGRFDGTANDSLRSVEAYVATMNRCRRAAGRLEPEVRWFVEPFGLVAAIRTVRQTERPKYQRDMAAILSEQGFDAVRGVGGYVNLLADGGAEFLHRTSIYAPPLPGKERDPLRWNLAMRIMQMPNSPALVPQSWVPRMSANYLTLNIDIQNAYENVNTLFDAIAGHEDAFHTTMEGLEMDPYGPQVNIRDEFIAHLGQRVTMMTNYKTPISVESEQSLFAVEAANEAKLAETLEKIMSKEPDVERREFGDIVIWERVPPEEAIEELQIDAPALSPLQMDVEIEPVEEEVKRDRVLPNSAVCVALGQLMMASDTEYLRTILGGFGQREMLISSDDYRQVVELLEQISPGPRSLWSFSRTDESFRPTYELIRQGRMPEANTLFAKMLNEMLLTEAEKDEGVLREQKIDGSELPSFEMVRRYFGPAGRALKSEKDGWFLTGAILNKEAP